MIDSKLRGEYLDRLGDSLQRSDWLLLSYALMSSHIHLALLAGTTPFWSLIKGPHIGFANLVNHRERGLGHVFAGRPKTLLVDPLNLPYVIAYQHNNTVHAKIVARAVDSSWTSHQAYMRIAPRPVWLQAKLGLQLLGFADDERGRGSFDVFVAQQESDPLGAQLGGDNLARDRRKLRAEIGAAIDCAFPTWRGDKYVYRIRCPAKPWAGTIDQVLAAVSISVGLPADVIVSRSRRAVVVSARRLVVLVGRCLGFSQIAIGLRLGISDPAASYLERTANTEVLEQARVLAAALASGEH